MLVVSLRLVDFLPRQLLEVRIAERLLEVLAASATLLYLCCTACCSFDRLAHNTCHFSVRIASFELLSVLQQGLAEL